MNKDITYFLNDYYILLRCLVENEVNGKKGSFVPLSQNDLSKETGFCKAKVNKLIRQLIKDGYVNFLDNSKYTINKKGYNVYNYIEKH